jgi:hypothetical protein
MPPVAPRLITPTSHVGPRHGGPDRGAGVDQLRWIPEEEREPLRLLDQARGWPHDPAPSGGTASSTMCTVSIVPPPHARRGREVVIEIDRHAAATAGAGRDHGCGRAAAVRHGHPDTIRRAVEGRWGGLTEGVELRYLWDRMQSRRPSKQAVWVPGAPPDEEMWRGVASEQRWAMEVLGLRSGMEVEREDVNRRFRRLLRDAHPDSGGVATQAAARIAELTEARTILLDVASEAMAAEG